MFRQRYTDSATTRESNSPAEHPDCRTFSGRAMSKGLGVAHLNCAFRVDT